MVGHRPDQSQVLSPRRGPREKSKVIGLGAPNDGGKPYTDTQNLTNPSILFYSVGPTENLSSN